jgi:hypothetical protein
VQINYGLRRAEAGQARGGQDVAAKGGHQGPYQALRQTQGEPMLYETQFFLKKETRRGQTGPTRELPSPSGQRGGYIPNYSFTPPPLSMMRPASTWEDEDAATEAEERAGSPRPEEMVLKKSEAIR